MANGLGTLTQANAMLYTLYETKSGADFHDITSGSNTSRFSATTGFDAVTGLGSPIVSSLVNDLAVATATSTTTLTTPITIAPVGGSRGGGWGGWGGGGWGGRGWGGWSNGWYSGFGMTAIASGNVPLAGYANSDASASSHFTDPVAGLGVTMAEVGNTTTADSLTRTMPAGTAAMESSALPGRLAPESRQADADSAEELLPTTGNAVPSFVEAPATAPPAASGILATLHSTAVDQIFGDPTTDAAAATVVAIAKRPLTPAEKKSAAPHSIGHAAASGQIEYDAPTSNIVLDEASIAAVVLAWQIRTSSAVSERDRPQARYRRWRQNGDSR